MKAELLERIRQAVVAKRAAKQAEKDKQANADKIAKEEAAGNPAVTEPANPSKPVEPTESAEKELSPAEQVEAAQASVEAAQTKVDEAKTVLKQVKADPEVVDAPVVEAKANVEVAKANVEVAQAKEEVAEAKVEVAQEAAADTNPDASKDTSKESAEGANSDTKEDEDTSNTNSDANKDAPKNTSKEEVAGADKEAAKRFDEEISGLQKKIAELEETLAEKTNDELKAEKDGAIAGVLGAMSNVIDVSLLSDETISKIFADIPTSSIIDAMTIISGLINGNPVVETETTVEETPSTTIVEEEPVPDEITSMIQETTPDQLDDNLLGEVLADLDK